MTTAKTPSMSEQDSDSMMMTEQKSGGSKAGVAVLVIGGLLLGAAGLAAANMGRNTVFSQLASYIPVEQIPVLNSFAKSNDQLLRDALYKEADYFTNTKALGGREEAMTASVMVKGEDESGVKMEIEFAATGKTQVNGDFSKSKASYTFGGKVKSGVVQVDLGKDGVVLDALMPNLQEVYVRAMLSDQMKETAEPFFVQMEQGIESTGEEFPFEPRDLVGKYWKMNFKDYFKVMGEMTGDDELANADFDVKKVQDAYTELMRAVGPDMQSVMDKTLGDFKRYGTLTSKGRMTVNGKAAIALQLEVSTEKMSPVMVEFAEQSIEVVKKHRTDFEKYCKAVSIVESSQEGCEEMFNEETMKDMESPTAEEKAEAEKSIKEGLEHISLAPMMFYVNPVDNSILKYEFKIGISDKGRTAIKENDGPSFEQMEFSLVGEELSRGKDFTVESPSDAIDLVEVMRKISNSVKESSSMYGAPSYGGTPSYMPPAGYEDYGTDPIDPSFYDGTKSDDYDFNY